MTNLSEPFAKNARDAKNYKEACDYYNKVLELNQFIERWKERTIGRL
jgi:hypothetical protein